MQTIIQEKSLTLGELPFQIGFDFVANPTAQELSTLNGLDLGTTMKVEPKLMEVLICLAEAHGRVVSTEYLVETIWGNYGGGKEALMQAISKLRKLLQDDAQKQRVIQTISKKGYRLLLPVKTLDIKTLRPPEQSKLKTSSNQKVGAFTGFIERLTKPKFFFAFLFFSVVVIFGLAILSYMVTSLWLWLG